MAHKEAHGGGGKRNVHIDNEYGCDETTHNEQLKACLQRLEERVDWFMDQLDALADQFADVAVANGHRRQPNLHFGKEDDDYNVDE